MANETPGQVVPGTIDPASRPPVAPAINYTDSRPRPADAFLPSQLPVMEPIPFGQAYAGQGFIGGTASTLADLYNTSFIAPGAYRGLESLTAPVDPNFKWTQETFDAFTSAYNIPTAIYADLYNARSMDHARIIRDQALDLQKSYSSINTYGEAGQLMMMGASLVDPTNLAMMAIPGVNGTKFAQVLTGAGRLRIAVANGLIQGAASASGEAVRVLNDPFADKSAIASAFLTAGVTGGQQSVMGSASRMRRFTQIGVTTGAATAASQYAFSDVSFRDAMASGMIAGLLGGGLSASNRAHDLYAHGIDQAIAKEILDSGLPLSPKGAKFVNEAFTPRKPVTPMPDSFIEMTRVAEGIYEPTITKNTLLSLPVGRESKPVTPVTEGVFFPSSNMTDSVYVDPKTSIEMTMAQFGDNAENITIADGKVTIRDDYGDIIHEAPYSDMPSNGAVPINNWKGKDWTIGRAATDQNPVASVQSANTDVPPAERSMARTAPIDVPPTAGGSGGGGPLGTVGAPAPEPKPMLPGDITFTGTTAERSMWADGPGAWFKRPFSIAANIGRSNNPDILLANNMIFDDALPKANGQFQPETALSAVRRLTESEQSQFLRVTQDEFAKFWNAQVDGGWMRPIEKHRAMTNFHEDITRYVRRPDAEIPDHLAASVAKFRERMAYMHEFANRHGVEGFGDFDKSDSYAMRVYSGPKIESLINRYGIDNFHAAWAKNWQSQNPTLDDAKALKLAKSVVSTIRSGKAGFDSNGKILIEGDLLAKNLRDNHGLSEEEIATILRQVKQNNEKGSDPRTMRRMNIDETFETQMPQNGHNGDGTVSTFRFEDMLENNAVALHEQYARHIYGRAAESKMLDRFTAADGKKLSSWAEVRQRMVRGIEDEMSAGKIDLTEAQRQYEHVNGLEAGWKMVLGVDPWQGEMRQGYVKALQRIRTLNYLTSMGQAGFANFADTFAAYGQVTHQQILDQAPVFKEMYQMAADGQLSNEFLRETEMVWGAGTDRMRSRSDNLTDTDAGVREFHDSRIDRTLKVMTNVQNDLSGMAPLEIALERGIYSIAQQKFADYAMNRVEFTDAHLESLGMTREMANRIGEMLRQHSKFAGEQTVTQGPDGVEFKTTPGALRKLNIDKWVEDPEAAAAFITNVDRFARRVVQRNDVGNMSLWMSKPMGKAMMQFRSFPIAAYEKQLLYPIATGNMEAYSGMVWSTIGAGMLVIARTYANSVGQPDREKFLKDRLSMSEIIKQSFAKSSWSSVLPMYIDTLALPTGGSVFGASQRNTGLSNDIWFGNPTLDKISNYNGLARAIVAPWVSSKYDFSRQDLQAARKWMPFQNSMPFNQILNATGGRLPKTSVTQP